MLVFIRCRWLNNIDARCCEEAKHGRYKYLCVHLFKLKTFCPCSFFLFHSQWSHRLSYKVYGVQTTCVRHVIVCRATSSVSVCGALVNVYVSPPTVQQCCTYWGVDIIWRSVKRLSLQAWLVVSFSSHTYGIWLDSRLDCGNTTTTILKT